MNNQISNELPQIQTTGNTPYPAQQNIEQPGNSNPVERQAPPAGNFAPQPQQQPAFAQQAIPQQPPVTPQQGTQSASAAMPTIADDADLIEKEWVAKAKEIVARTKNDPYMQNKEVEIMKADYMKKRYNKDIKLTDD